MAMRLYKYDEIADILSSLGWHPTDLSSATQKVWKHTDGRVLNFPNKPNGIPDHILNDVYAHTKDPDDEGICQEFLVHSQAEVIPFKKVTH